MSAVVDYRRQIYAIRDLPTLPIIAQKILAVVDDDNSEADKLAKIIESDQALAVRILSLANSAYYGRRAQIATVKQAIVVIGWVMLKQISLSVLICKSLGPGGSRVAFWRHSLMAANAASLTAGHAKVKATDVAFMGGLLHDVGKLVLDATLPKEYARVRKIVEKEGCGFVEAEQSVFQTDHVEVGAWMAERWQFPEELIGAIGLHHTAEQPAGPHAKLIASVYASNALVDAADRLARTPGTPASVILPDPILASLAISESALASVAAELHSKRKLIEHMLF